MKNGHFIITYLVPIKNLKKIQFWKILDFYPTLCGFESWSSHEIFSLFFQNETKTEEIYDDQSLNVLPE